MLGGTERDGEVGGVTDDRVMDGVAHGSVECTLDGIATGTGGSIVEGTVDATVDRVVNGIASGRARGKVSALRNPESSSAALMIVSGKAGSIINT